MPDVLNSRPLTETVLPLVSEPSPEESMKSILDSVVTLIVVIGGIAPVNRGESPPPLSVRCLLAMKCSPG